jgi:uncharacterized membrane protein YcaP (DUF421 family)
MFDLTARPLEIVVRVAIVYLGLFLLLRLVGKKELGQLAPMDLVTLLILSETVSPALTAADASLTAAALSAGTLLLITFAIDWLTYRSPRLTRLVEGEASVLIEDGKVDRDIQRREKLSDDEIYAALRREGVAGPEEVRRAYVETNGRITVLKTSTGGERR